MIKSIEKQRRPLLTFSLVVEKINLAAAKMLAVVLIGLILVCAALRVKKRK